MLRKLIKHEFRATGRLMWVIYLAMALLSVGANISLHLIDKSGFVRNIAILVIVMWGLALVVGTVMTVVLLVKRFHQNLLTDEGYLSFTLPVTTHHLVLSKLLTAAIWLMATVLVLLLCVLIAVFENDMLRYFLEGLRQTFQEMTLRLALNDTAVIVEILVLLFVSIACSLLQFYSAMAIGYGFSDHKGLLSVVFYFLQVIVINILETAGLSIIGNNHFSMIVTAPAGTDVWNITIGSSVLEFTSMQTWHLGLLTTIVYELIVCAAFYMLTVVNLKKRLNLA